ncbi:hypothetical protein [Ruminococcus sp.]|jgi:hypothetical protein|nr:hypothetical protein [Ruminococcus sp.]
MKELNQNVSFDNEFETVIEEMLEREEFMCTGHGCTGHAQGL